MFHAESWSVRFNRIVYKVPASLLTSSSPLWPYWLRSSVVSVLNSLTTIMEARLYLVILFLPPQFLGLCSHPLDVMTLLLQNRLASSEDLHPFLRVFSLLKVSTVHNIYGAADFSKQIIAAVVSPYWFTPFCFQSFPVSEGSVLRPWISELFHKIKASSLAVILISVYCLRPTSSY